MKLRIEVHRQRSGNPGAGADVNALRRLVSLAAASLALAFFGAASHASLPLDAYRELQAGAPEWLILHIDSVTTEEAHSDDFRRVTVTLEARVMNVHRSSSGLKQGDVIRITYENNHRIPPSSDPPQLPILEKGAVYPSYLIRRGTVYKPAAGIYSFAPAPFR